MMRIQIDGERCKDFLCEIEGYFIDEFDEDISIFQVEGLFDFFVEKFGFLVYNQVICDVYFFLQDKFVDFEGDFYELEL